MSNGALVCIKCNNVMRQRDALSKLDDVILCHCGNLMVDIQSLSAEKKMAVLETGLRDFLRDLLGETLDKEKVKEIISTYLLDILGPLVPTVTCGECNSEVDMLVPMGLFGKKHLVCQNCKDKFKKDLGIDKMSYGMQYFFNTGVDRFPESNSDHW